LVIAVNAAGSLTARSARILRSSPISAFFRPGISREYVVPSMRAAALMRAIQSLRKSRRRSRRPMYMYCQAFRTASTASPKMRLRAL
jgi:hypothetical protein